MNIESVNLHGKIYLEIDRIVVSNKTFVYLVNKEDSEDFCIRKLKVLDGKIFYEGLKDSQEFDLAMMYFTRKHENIIFDENE